MNTTINGQAAWLAGELRTLAAIYAIKDHYGRIGAGATMLLYRGPDSSVAKRLRAAGAIAHELFARLVAPTLEDIRPDPILRMDNDGLIRRSLVDGTEQAVAVIVEQVASLLWEASHQKIEDEPFRAGAARLAEGLERAIACVRSDPIHERSVPIHDDPQPFAEAFGKLKKCERVAFSQAESVMKANRDELVWPDDQDRIYELVREEFHRPDQGQRVPPADSWKRYVREAIRRLDGNYRGENVPARSVVRAADLNKRA